MTPATILLTATFQVISNCMNNGSITQHVIANRFLHTNSKEASGSIDAKASLSLSEFYDLYKDSNIRHSAKIPLCLFLDHLRRILAIQFKPERNAVLTVVNAVWLSQLLHGCLDNGKGRHRCRRTPLFSLYPPCRIYPRVLTDLPPVSAHQYCEP